MKCSCIFSISTDMYMTTYVCTRYLKESQATIISVDNQDNLENYYPTACKDTFNSAGGRIKVVRLNGPSLVVMILQTLNAPKS
jgi:hypothetical protein